MELAFDELKSNAGLRDCPADARQSWARLWLGDRCAGKQASPILEFEMLQEGSRHLGADAGGGQGGVVALVGARQRAQDPQEVGGHARRRLRPQQPAQQVLRKSSLSDWSHAWSSPTRLLAGAGDSLLAAPAAVTGSGSRYAAFKQDFWGIAFIIQTLTVALCTTEKTDCETCLSTTGGCSPPAAMNWRPAARSVATRLAISDAMKMRPSAGAAVSALASTPTVSAATSAPWRTSIERLSSSAVAMAKNPRAFPRQWRQHLWP